MAESGDLSRRPRRFYQDVSIAAQPDGFALRLDDRAARTPGARAMTLPTRALAELVADEWRAQTDGIAMVSMPATRLAHTAIDVVADARDASLQA